MFKHRVDRMKKLYGDDDEGLLGFFALRLLAQIERRPLGAPAAGFARGGVGARRGEGGPAGGSAGRGGLAAVDRTAGGVADRGGVVEREAARAGVLGSAPDGARAGLGQGWAVGNCARMPRARALSRSPRAVRCSGRTTSSWAMSWRRLSCRSAMSRAP